MIENRSEDIFVLPRMRRDCTRHCPYRNCYLRDLMIDQLYERISVDMEQAYDHWRVQSFSCVIPFVSSFSSITLPIIEGVEERSKRYNCSEDNYYFH